MKRYKAHIGHISPPRKSEPKLLGEFDAANGDAAIARGNELAREKDLQGTVQVTVA